MPAYVVAIVLTGALLHASWNALVKSGHDTYLTTVIVTCGAGLLSALALPWLRAPDAASWPFIVASALIQQAYYELLVATYRDGDISHAYPLMRGSAPMLVALASAPLLGERLAPLQWLAVCAICGGILGLYFAVRSQAPHARRTTALALATACTIAMYTMVDGAGVRKSGAPAAYTMWVFLLTAAGVGALGWKRRGRELAAYTQRHAGIALAGGLGALASYGLALWAMTVAPVAAVAALRETSILFATAIAALVLREKISGRRYLAIALVACGAALMRLA